MIFHHRNKISTKNLLLSSIETVKERTRKQWWVRQQNQLCFSFRLCLQLEIFHSVWMKSFLPSAYFLHYCDSFLDHSRKLVAGSTSQTVFRTKLHFQDDIYIFIYIFFSYFYLYIFPDIVAKYDTSVTQMISDSIPNFDIIQWSLHYIT